MIIKQEIPPHHTLLKDNKGERLPSYMDVHSLHCIGGKVRAALNRDQTKDSLRDLFTLSNSISSRAPINGGHNETFDIHNYSKTKRTKSGLGVKNSCNDFFSVMKSRHSQERIHAVNKRPVKRIQPLNSADEKLRNGPCSASSSTSEHYTASNLSKSGTSIMDGVRSSPKDNVERNDKEHVNISPFVIYRDILKKEGVVDAFRSSGDADSYFVRPKMEKMDSYYNTIKTALLIQDIPLLRVMQEEGISLQCSNSAGESLIHLSCRCGFTEVTRFLIEEAGFSLRVVDDSGRTPLHYACQCQEQNLDNFEFLIREEPDLLLIRDKNGLTPLEYVMSDKFGIWADFISSRMNILKPRYFGIE